MTQNEDPLLQIKLSQFLQSHLGDSSYKEISTELAIYLEAKCANKLLIHIQWIDEYGRNLSRPILWRYKAWFEDSERQLRLKELSRIARETKFVFDSNVTLVQKVLMREPMSMPENVALSTAFGLVKKGRKQAMKVFGINKLFEKVEEL